MTDSLSARANQESGPALVRWGILGTGGIAGDFAADLAHLDGAELVAVGSRSGIGAQKFADQFAVPRPYASYADLVADPEVDVVYVATPHPQHHGNALLAIAAGKPVLVEKAFTVNAGEARALVEAARAAGVFAMEAMWTRFLPHFRRLRELLDGGAVGTIRSVHADHGQWFPLDPSHRLFAPDLGGGALLDLGVYPVSFASFVLGTPTGITASGEMTSTGVDAQTSMILDYEDGAHAVLTCTLESATPCRAWVAGTEGRIELAPTWYAPSVLTLTRRDGHSETFDGTDAAIGDRTARPRPGKGLRFEAAEVGRCLRAGLLESPVMPLAESVSIMETMDEVRRQTEVRYPFE